MIKNILTWSATSVGLRWIGISILLLAYILVSWGIFIGTGFGFQLMNIAGSAMLIASSLKMNPKDIPVIVFNAFWILIALITLFHIILSL